MAKSDAPLVSVIIPTYDAAAYIRETVASALAQTYPNVEVIVVDDASTDNTREVLEQFIRDKKIAYYARARGEAVHGPSVTRDTGIAHARGEFIAFIDTNDLYLPTKLEKQVGYLRTHPECGVSYCDIWHFFDGAPEKLFMNTRSRYTGPDTFRTLLKMNFMNPLMIVMRRSVISQFGAFDESYPRSEDWEYWVRLSYHGVQFAHLGGEPQAKYRIRASGLSYGWKIKVEEKRTMLRIFTELEKKMTPRERAEYHIEASIVRQRMKLWAAYFGNLFSPVKYLYEWLQKKRLASA
jgi:glycosyltransferase involved in cell wall biosynthesis